MVLQSGDAYVLQLKTELDELVLKLQQKEKQNGEHGMGPGSNELSVQFAELQKKYKLAQLALTHSGV
jgi:hypothetical protein|tara:strand:- start:221 stop:421 length:201 start_codon:yes stop_codon:yes gene_type:complete